MVRQMVRRTGFVKGNFTTEAVLRSLVRGVLALAVAGVVLLAIVVAVGLWETWRWQRGEYKRPVVSDTGAFYTADAELAELAQLSEVHDLLTAQLLEPEAEGLESGFYSESFGSYFESSELPAVSEGIETFEPPELYFNSSGAELESPELPARSDGVQTARQATRQATRQAMRQATRQARGVADTGDADFVAPFRRQAWWSRAQQTAESLPDAPRVVVVLDDLGFSALQWELILDIPPPLTLSFLPSAPSLVEWAQAAGRRGHEVLLHLPMEPKGRQDPGANALRVADTPEMRQANLRRLLSSATAMGAVGANNHMGSRATEDSILMGEVLSVLGERGLLFLDSRTTAASVASTEALRLRVAFAERDIFLDHELREESVRSQLLALEWIARRRGYAIAIGHPHRITLSVLAEWVMTLESRGLVLVPLSAVVAEAGGYLPRASGLR